MEPTVEELHFLEGVLRELRGLERAAQAHHRGVLAGMLSAARRETEMLLREDLQARAWPKSADDRWAKHH
jgi:hypothetical protein